MAVMHFCHFDVESVLFQNPSGLAGEPEQGVDADGEVWGVDDGDDF